MISIGVEVRPSLYGTARPGRPRRCSDCVGLWRQQEWATRIAWACPCPHRQPTPTVSPC